MFSKKRYKRLLLFFICSFLVFAIPFYGKEYISNYYLKLNLDTTTAPTSASRLLVFAPHCDDETLGTGELIAKTIENGGSVKVVIVTNGDGFKDALELDYHKLAPNPPDYIKFGYQRQQESIAALKKLGLSEKNILFLGYPDGGLSPLWSTNWDATAPYTSQYTATNFTPYTNSFTPHGIYCGESILTDFKKIIEDFQPTDIAFPHPNDRHPDHWGTNAFVKYALTVTNYSPKKEWLYLVHRGDWPTPLKKNTNLYLLPPAKLVSCGTNWSSLNLSSDEILQKEAAIHMYATQIKILGPLMNGFERKNELFGEYKDSTLIKNINEDNQIIANNTNKLIIDPLQDYLSVKVNKSADISALYGELSKSNVLHLFIETDSQYYELKAYDINLIFFNNTVVSKLNLEITDDSIKSKYLSKDSNINITEIISQTGNKPIHVSIPIKNIGSFDHLFINATTSIERYALDKTAWRMVINP